jgi:hypothetical protein
VAAQEPRPQDQLRRFLDTLHDELQWALDRHPEWFGRRHREFIDAWRELQERFEAARRGLEEVDPDALAREGLTGAQLRLKLALFDDALDHLRGSSPPGDGPRGPLARLRRLLGRRRGVARLFDKLLEVANVILDSLGDVIPGAGAIGEFKDEVKSRLDRP